MKRGLNLDESFNQINRKKSLFMIVDNTEQLNFLTAWKMSNLRENLKKQLKNSGFFHMERGGLTVPLWVEAVIEVVAEATRSAALQSREYVYTYIHTYIHMYVHAYTYV